VQKELGVCGSSFGASLLKRKSSCYCSGDSFSFAGEVLDPKQPKNVVRNLDLHSLNVISCDVSGVDMVFHRFRGTVFERHHRL
jgi:hypothetical protein